MKYLQELNLKFFNTSETSVEILAEVLPSLQLLEKLVLIFDVVEIAVDNSCDKQLFGALRNLKYLKELNLGFLNTTETGVETLAEVLPSLQLLEKLELDVNRSKVTFDISRNKQLFGALRRLKYLKELDICFLNTTETLAEVLPLLQLLEVLKLGEIVLDDGIAKQLFAAVGKLKYLKEIDLRFIDIIQSGAESLAEVLPSLQLLEVLKLGKSAFDDGSGKQLFHALGKLKYLKNLEFDGTLSTRANIADFAEALPSLHCLEKLSLRSISFENESDQQLFAAMESLRVLNKLYLYVHPITQTVATTLISVLPRMCSLKCVKLLRNENETLVKKLEEVARLIPGLHVSII